MLTPRNNSCPSISQTDCPWWQIFRRSWTLHSEPKTQSISFSFRFTCISLKVILKYENVSTHTFLSAKGFIPSFSRSDSSDILYLISITDGYVVSISARRSTASSWGVNLLTSSKNFWKSFINCTRKSSFSLERWLTSHSLLVCVVWF